MIIIREGIIADIPAVIEFLMRMHNQNKSTWFEILADGRHPSTDISNFILAQDTDNNKIAALTIYQTYNYSYCGNIIKGVRLEEFFCDPDYQNKGIMPKILNKIAELSEDKGYIFELVFVGLYSFFDHLDYTFGIPCEGDGYTYLIEDVEAGHDFRIETATNDDIPAIAKMYEKMYTRNLLTTAIGYKEIDYIKNVYNGSVSYTSEFYVIKSSSGICGFFLTQLNEKNIYMMELNDNCSYYQIRPYLIEFYKKHGLNKIPFMLGKVHPVYTVFKGYYHQKSLPEFGFVKVRNIPNFLLSISQTLNERLVNSPYSHLSKSFVVAMRNKGEAYKLVFEHGKLTDVSPVKQDFGQVYIERDRFIKLLFGRVPVAEEAFMYSFENEDYRNIFEILFPQMPSYVISLN